MQPFRGSDRFELLRELGSGSFGTVYEAFDRRRGQLIALKVLQTFCGASLFHFKQEFRALADLSHPNLVVPQELLLEQGVWAIVMDLVQGQDFFKHLRRREGTAVRTSYPLPDMPTPPRAFPSAVRDQIKAGNGHPDLAYSLPPDMGAIRSVMIQLVNGLAALHGAGFIHRDLKPGNVLVTWDGQVKILDFGLVIRPDGSEIPEEDHAAGTPAYAAPEALVGRGQSPASDFYSVGVMLYQVLTGQLPFVGTYLEIFRAKQGLDPCPPSLLLPSLPSDLASLAEDLLKQDPETRPGAQEILERLQAAPVSAETPLVFRESMVRVGREQEFNLLLGAFDSLRTGKGRVVHLSGASGMGKSHLARRFLREVKTRDPGALVLQGRCHEQEIVPFKALDAVVDGLVRYLEDLPPDQRAELLPVDLPSLARLFPAFSLTGLTHPEESLSTQLEGLEPAELRRRAFQVFKELLATLATHQRVVVLIDDLQWGDLDSASLLSAMLQPPREPALLLVLCYRSGESIDVAGLATLCQESPFGAEALHLELQELNEEDTEALTLALVGPEGSEVRSLVQGIARASKGNPFIIEELARHVRGGGSVGGGLEASLRARLQALDVPSLRLMTLLSVAGQPLPWDILRHASGLGPMAFEALDRLVRQRLVQSRTLNGRRILEPYHDRIRESAWELLDSQALSREHLSLAEAWKAVSDPDPRALARHYLGAGDAGLAATYAELSAQRAEAALAFDQAADFYLQVLELRAPDGQEAAFLWKQLADALANAGRSSESASGYLEAARMTTGRQALRLQRRAAEEWLRSGHIDDGVATLKGVLSEAGASYPANPLLALIYLLYYRLRLRLRGLRFQEHREDEVSEDVLERVDTLWAAAMGLGPVDIFRGAAFQARQLLLTLKVGEPFRIIRALAHEVIFVAKGGRRSAARARQLQGLVLDLAERQEHPNPKGRAYIAAGISALLQGRWKAAVEFSDKAVAILKGHCTGVDYELHITHHQSLQARYALGQYAEVARRLPELLQAARARGDLLAQTDFRTSLGFLVHLMADEPQRGLQDLDHAVSGWTNRGFHTQHYHELVARVHLELYLQKPQVARDFLESRWGPLRRSMLLQVQGIRITCWELRARVALACVVRQVHEKRNVIPRALKIARRLRNEGVEYGRALGLKLGACIAFLEGRNSEAMGLLFQAEVAFETCDMAVHAAICRMARGHLEGDRGRDLERSALAILVGEGIRNPWKFARIHLPGVPVPEE